MDISISVFDDVRANSQLIDGCH